MIKNDVILVNNKEEYNGYVDLCKGDGGIIMEMETQIKFDQEHFLSPEIKEFVEKIEIELVKRLDKDLTEDES
ncbi:hypothetical protein D3C79_1067620 [compost metagenome]